MKDDLYPASSIHEWGLPWCRLWYFRDPGGFWGLGIQIFLPWCTLTLESMAAQ